MHFYFVEIGHTQLDRLPFKATTTTKYQFDREEFENENQIKSIKVMPSNRIASGVYNRNTQSCTIELATTSFTPFDLD